MPFSFDALAFDALPVSLGSFALGEKVQNRQDSVFRSQKRPHDVRDHCANHNAYWSEHFQTIPPLFRRPRYLDSVYFGRYGKRENCSTLTEFRDAYVSNPCICIMSLNSWSRTAVQLVEHTRHAYVDCFHACARIAPRSIKCIFGPLPRGASFAFIAAKRLVNTLIPKWVTFSPLNRYYIVRPTVNLRRKYLSHYDQGPKGSLWRNPKVVTLRDEHIALMFLTPNSCSWQINWWVWVKVAMNKLGLETVQRHNLRNIICSIHTVTHSDVSMFQ